MQEKNNTVQVSDELVLDKIYYIRDQKVMLDSDLAKLYGVETKQLKRQVNRNIERFPEDFMFELSPNEVTILRSQFGTSSWGGTRYLPMAFTEHGVLMLSSVLNSPKAIQTNILIMRVFARIRKTLTDTTELKLAIEELKRKTENKPKTLKLSLSIWMSYSIKKKMVRRENQLVINQTRNTNAQKTANKNKLNKLN